MKILKIVFFPLVFLLGTFFWIFLQFSGPEKVGEKERYLIGLGTGQDQIIRDLKQKGFLKNEKIFELILSLKGQQGKIQPGAYQIAKSMNAYQLAGTLVYGPYQKWALIPPGKRKEQVGLILKRALDWPDPVAVSFINLAQEGYLYPDTYLINIDADPQEVILKLKGNFEEKFEATLQKELLEQNIRNDTALKIASLIERESGGDEDKAVIAGIIWNRLSKKMRLEIDATVQYALANQKCFPEGVIRISQLESCDFWPRVTGTDLRATQSAYNTYKNDGLPPEPICSPGLASIKAVVYPAETEAFYYLHSPDKKIHTAKTLKEHQENIEEYLR